MNLVGQLAESVFVTVRELYKGLNPATLTGCIDVLVVRQQDGSYQCSPFHVRFGKLGVLRSKEKVVDIEINGEPVDLRMKLGDNGAAFFVQETETNEEAFPMHLCTSPFPAEDSENAEHQTVPARLSEHLLTPQLSQIKEPELADSDTSIRKKKKLRKKVKLQESTKEDATQSTDDGTESDPSLDEKCKHLCISNSIYYSFTDISSMEDAALQSKEFYPFSDGEYAPPTQSLSMNRPSSPKSDSELEIKSPDLSLGGAESHMEWKWGKLPEVSKLERTDLPKSARNSPSITLKDWATHDPLEAPKNDSIFAIEPCETTHFQTIAADFLDDLGNMYSTGSSHPTQLLRPEPLFQCDPSTLGAASQAETTCTGEREYLQREKQTMAMKHKLERQKPVVATEMSEEPKLEALKLVLHLEEMPGTSQTGLESTKPAGYDASTGLKSCKQSKKVTMKRSQHLGPSDIYLDDIKKLRAEEISLYFPKSDFAPPDKPLLDASTGSPAHLLGNITNDSGLEFLSDPISQLGDKVKVSLCGGLGDRGEIQHKKFKEHKLTYNMLASNPALLEDPNLVVRINKKYYNWAVAAPMILSLQAFQRNLPKITIDKLVKEKMPKKSGRWWFSWRRKDFAIKENEVQAETFEAEKSKQKVQPPRKKKCAKSREDESANQKDKSTTQSVSQGNPKSISCPTYKKSLRLTSEQISHLNLQDGPNDAVFSVTTQYQGTCRCEATIYLWNWDDKIIISDIDGTITRSDALGHILPQLGKDWTHQGIAQLYHKIHLNGYKFLYCSARAIGMADITKGYLQGVCDRGCELPKGPVLLAPNSLFSALHREVIERKPEVFKITCLRDIKNLFNPQEQPFYAAFGNKPNDVYAYKQVGLPESRIFTVNYKGELMQELTKNKSSYSRLSELVELIFPPLNQSSPFALLKPEFSNFNFWKHPIPSLSTEDIADIL
ncbi:phosphatidate phosphatase LPIN3 [Rhinatrema bivittatum]|uniref:phosphatidate phosphatase LPIN3 n=1 Tax=Rhinatrema bivittatum TaxID=194408 RepID=UPI001125E7D7|nr:phosphatidate phosphatase LPIN3 [Rhinatrema bivittatum]XP_029468087.1 phosphatidate phosphatase LPIN3 [Rhinatrema bivittatum]XP_029468088.1 phosphatidate phosphatase LPIN3 [Rhinatrema bivittatum]XP_029468089.1 phosphatidate phosphatase LPIN3 [Rhinatrema bivittatum]XP_029468090.1 phosphatidate phosphatase LPIN3 [Rhinatrema bivittatum]